MKDTLSTSVSKPADFGVFNQLAGYGALGLAVLGLGFVAWLLFKRNTNEQGLMRLKIQEMERRTYLNVIEDDSLTQSDTNRAAAIQEQAIVAKMSPAPKKRAAKMSPAKKKTKKQ